MFPVPFIACHFYLYIIQSNKYNEHSIHTLEVAAKKLANTCMQAKSRVVSKSYIINIVQVD